MKLAFYFTAILFALTISSSYASQDRDGVITVSVNTTTRYNGVVGDFKKEKLLFNFIVGEINKGDFGWDKVWSFKDIGSGNFELFDQVGNFLTVSLDKAEGLAHDLNAILAMPANSRIGRVESIASHIGNSVNKAYLKLKETVTQESEAVEKTEESSGPFQTKAEALEQAARKEGHKEYVIEKTDVPENTTDESHRRFQTKVNALEEAARKAGHKDYTIGKIEDIQKNVTNEPIRPFETKSEALEEAKWKSAHKEFVRKQVNNLRGMRSKVIM